LLEVGYLTLREVREVAVKTVTVFVFRVNDGGSNGIGCCGIEVRTGTHKVDESDNRGLRKR